MNNTFPQYGITGNGVDTWYLDIFWGGACKKGRMAVQNVATFKAKGVRKHSTEYRTLAFKAKEYLWAKGRAIKEMKRLRQVDPVRPADEPKLEPKKK